MNGLTQPITQALKDLCDPFPEDALDYYEVDKKVGNVRNNS